MKIPKELTTVTPLSKAVALCMFIVLPIIAFILGMHYQTMLEESRRTLFTCPREEYVDCMPGRDRIKRPECSAEFLQWAHANCPKFKGAAL